MKIREIVFLPHRLKRKYRWQTASYTADYVELFYVTILTDHGLTGIGAASVMPSRGDPLQTGIAALKSVVDALFMNRDPLEIDDLMELLDQRVHGFVRHKAGIEIALYDLFGKAQNASVSTLLGGNKRLAIPVLKMLGMGTPEWMAERASQFAKQGYRYLKVKLGAGFANDLDRFVAVRKSVGGRVTLTGDFNGAYDAATAIQVIEKLAADGLAMVEQPVPPSDLAGMAEVRRAVKPLVLADQSVNSPQDVVDVAKMGAAGAVSIKLLKLGGIRKSAAVARACQSHGLSCHVGGTGTSRLVEAAQAHFISATPAVIVPCEIAEFEELDGDLVAGLEVVDGAVRVPSGPGLGVSLLA
jgi:L-alanine-DL-glutamate epimerase-like enolase superfamily enzyme